MCRSWTQYKMKLKDTGVKSDYSDYSTGIPLKLICNDANAAVYQICLVYHYLFTLHRYKKNKKMCQTDTVPRIYIYQTARLSINYEAYLVTHYCH